MNGKRILLVLLAAAILAATPAIGYTRSRSTEKASTLITSCLLRETERLYHVTALWEADNDGAVYLYAFYRRYRYPGDITYIAGHSLTSFIEKYLSPAAKVLCVEQITSPGGAPAFQIFYTK